MLYGVDNKGSNLKVPRGEVEDADRVQMGELQVLYKNHKWCAKYCIKMMDDKAHRLYYTCSLSNKIEISLWDTSGA